MKVSNLNPYSYTAARRKNNNAADETGKQNISFGTRTDLYTFPSPNQVDIFRRTIERGTKQRPELSMPLFDSLEKLRADGKDWALVHNVIMPTYESGMYQRIDVEVPELASILHDTSGYADISKTSNGKVFVTLLKFDGQLDDITRDAIIKFLTDLTPEKLAQKINDAKSNPSQYRAQALSYSQKQLFGKSERPTSEERKIEV